MLDDGSVIKINFNKSKLDPEFYKSILDTQNQPCQLQQAPQSQPGKSSPPKKQTGAKNFNLSEKLQQIQKNNEQIKQFQESRLARQGLKSVSIYQRNQNPQVGNNNSSLQPVLPTDLPRQHQASQ